MTTENKTVKMTIAGDTYKAREKLREEGFAWDADTKSWSREYVCGKSAFGVDGFCDANGNYKGDEKSIASMVRAYAKSDRFTITVE